MRTVARALVAITLSLLGNACMALPDRADIDERTAAWMQRFDKQRDTGIDEAALRKAVGDDPRQQEFALRLAAMEKALTGQPLAEGNKVELLLDGPQTHEAQIAAIRKARYHVHLAIYILTDEKLGQRYAEALIERAKAGVKVRFMFDGHGSQDAAPEYLQRMRDAGVELHEFNPLKDPRFWRLNHRNHRKLLIVDGKVGFTGGINIVDDYVSSSSGATPSESGKRGWRDTHIRVEGPAVAGFQRAFIKAWEEVEKKMPDSVHYYPKLEKKGDSLVRLIADDGADLIDVLADPALKAAGKKESKKDAPKIYLSYLVALTEARSRIWISQSYFAPNEALTKALIDAAKHGVDVRLLVPGESDIAIALQLSQSYYGELLDAGVRIYEFQPSIMHAKTAVVDGLWSTVGSSNLDYRSFVHNDEANAIVIGREFGQEMEKMFLNDLKHAKEIKKEQWADRGLWKRMKERFARLTVYWL